MYALINKQKMELVCRFPDLNAREADHMNPPFVTVNVSDNSELESNNDIKKTTSSTTLGEWQKVRLNG